MKKAVKSKLDAVDFGVVDVMSVEDSRLDKFLYYIRKAGLPENKAVCYAAVYVEYAPYVNNIAGH